MSLPVGVGFGIRDAETARAISRVADAVVIGSRLVQKSREAEPLSVYAKSDLVQYIRNCIFPEQGRAASANAMEYSADLATTFGGMNNPALSSTYHNPANGFLPSTGRIQRGRSAPGGNGRRAPRVTPRASESSASPSNGCAPPSAIHSATQKLN